MIKQIEIVKTRATQPNPSNDLLSQAEKNQKAKDFLITLIGYLVAYQFLLGLFNRNRD